jgi:hypothetical protein
MTQDQVDRNLKWGIIFSIVWLAGIGSLLATIFGFRARKRSAHQTEPLWETAGLGGA